MTACANRGLVDLAMQALDRREWPRTETEIRIARASLFAAQVIASDLIAAGHEHEVEEIRDFISTIVPEPDPKRPAGKTSAAQTGHTDKNST